MNQADLIAIDEIVSRFYALFTNKGRQPNVRDIENIFIPEGILINNTKGKEDIYTLEEFIIPREVLLSDGLLVDFEEYEISHRTEIQLSIGSRTSTYEKSGVLHGAPFKGRGIKMMQFIKQQGKWKMSTVIWNDSDESLVSKPPKS